MTIIDRPRRQYRIRQTSDGKLWTAFFYPRNPRTGEPWQAPRGLTCGKAIVHRWDHNMEEFIPAVNGRFPADPLEGGKWSGAMIGYATEEDALAAVELYEAEHS